MQSGNAVFTAPAVTCSGYLDKRIRRPPPTSGQSGWAGFAATPHTDGRSIPQQSGKRRLSLHTAAVRRASCSLRPDVQVDNPTFPPESVIKREVRRNAPPRPALRSAQS